MVPLERLMDNPEIQANLAKLITSITHIASESVTGEPGGRFSRQEMAQLSTVNELVGQITQGVAGSIANKWGHSQGSIMRRIAPGIFTTREPTDWNHFQGRYSAILKAKGQDGVCPYDSA